MVRRRLAYLAAMACASLVTSVSAALAEPRAMIELFTSQGCSSCPAADKLLGELAHDSSLVAISVPIDYWDYLGWKDTLAKPGHSRRQRGYARARGDRQVYTPQTVVNGIMHALGSDKDAIERAIAQTRSNDGIMTLAVKIAIADGKLTVKVPAANDARGEASVWLCPISREVPVTISRGENRGRTVIYHNVVRRWVKLGDWNGSPKSFDVPLSEVSAIGIDAAAVIVQSGATDRPGAIYGAAISALR